MLVALEGTLGAGKTTLTKCVGAELGVKEVISSPTFTMLNEYHSGELPLYHLDIYRGGETGESMDLDTLGMEMDELMADGGIMLVEWPQYFLCEGENYFASRDHLKLGLAIYSGVYTGVLREDLSAQDGSEKYIKDGFTESRIASLSAEGPFPANLLATLSDKLSAMVINL